MRCPLFYVACHITILAKALLPVHAAKLPVSWCITSIPGMMIELHNTHVDERHLSWYVGAGFM